VFFLLLFSSAAGGQPPLSAIDLNHPTSWQVLCIRFSKAKAFFGLEILVILPTKQC
jgi:hypothetical protein